MQLVRAGDKVAVRGDRSAIPIQMHRWCDDLPEGEEVSVVFYRAPAVTIRERLELKGYTLELATAALVANLQAEAVRAKNWSECERGEIFLPLVATLENATVAAWFSALREIHDKDLQSSRQKHAADNSLLGYMLSHDWLGSGPDPFVGIRLALEVCEPDAELIYDITDLVRTEASAEDEEDYVAYVDGLMSSSYASSAKTIILTEGRTDSRFISESLKLLYPHLAEYFSFMDFENARVSGGAGNLANLVKAFAGAGIVNKTIAIFDNDTAGDAAMLTLRSVTLPDSIRVLRLPDSEFLLTYPTIGPSGATPMNVNGRAASIELYLGADVLRDENGELLPVQWTGYEPALQKYQGEVLFKDRIRERFDSRLDACLRDPDRVKLTDWSGIRQILQMLFSAFHDSDGKEILAGIAEWMDL